MEANFNALDLSEFDFGMIICLKRYTVRFKNTVEFHLDIMFVALVKYILWLKTAFKTVERDPVR